MTDSLVPIILGTGGTLLAAISAFGSVLVTMLRGMKADSNRQFDKLEAQVCDVRTTHRTDLAELRRENEQAHAAMRQENRDAHAAITENILHVERQQEKGLDRLYGLLTAVLPRAAAEQGDAPPRS